MSLYPQIAPVYYVYRGFKTLDSVLKPICLGERGYRVMLYIIIMIIYGIIWGVVCDKVVSNKGYNESWFWWGFFFGIFAFLVAVTKPTVSNTQYVSTRSDSRLSQIANDVTRERRMESRLGADQWYCGKCGRNNPKYLTTCVCGQPKDENKTAYEKFKEAEEEASKWTCGFCGNRNPKNFAICKCGAKKSEADKIEYVAKENVGVQNTDVVMSDKDSADALLKFKELLDMGVISQEEFDAKKKQILGL